jgi:hypothetical protein
VHRSCESYGFIAARYARERSEADNVAISGQNEK